MNIAWIPVPLVGALLAASSDSSLPGLPAPAQYGILGIGIAVLASGRVVVPIGWLKDEQAARARAEERAELNATKLEESNKDARESMVPALVESNRVLSETSGIIHDLYEQERNRRRSG